MIPQISIIVNFISNILKDLTLRDVLFIVIVLLIAYISFIKAWQIPHEKEKWDEKHTQLQEQYTDLLDQLNKPPTEELKKGEDRKEEVVDTTEKTPTSTAPVLVSEEEVEAYQQKIHRLESKLEETKLFTKNARGPVKKYQSQVEDTLIKGTITGLLVGSGYIKHLGLTYRFKKPIYTSYRVDTLIKTRTVTLTKWRNKPGKWRLNPGIIAGYNNSLEKPIIGIQAIAISPEFYTYSFAWDPLNNIYLGGITINF